MPLQKLPESVAILGWPPVATLSCRIGDLATRFPRRHVRPSPDHPAPYSWSLCRHHAASPFTPDVSKHL